MEHLFFPHLKPVKLLVIYSLMLAVLAILAAAIYQLEKTSVKSAGAPHDHEWLYAPAAEQFHLT